MTQPRPVTDRQFARFVAALADGNPRSFHTLADACGTHHLNSLQAEAKARGLDVRSWRVPTGRDEKHRPTATWYFRMVALEGADVPCLAALASAPSSAAVGDPAVTGSAGSRLAPEVPQRSARHGRLSRAARTERGEAQGVGGDRDSGALAFGSPPPTRDSRAAALDSLRDAA